MGSIMIGNVVAMNTTIVSMIISMGTVAAMNTAIVSMAFSIVCVNSRVSITDWFFRGY